MSNEREREAFEAAMGSALIAEQGKFALSRAYEEGRPYTFLATKWAWAAWQAAFSMMLNQNGQYIELPPEARREPAHQHQEPVAQLKRIHPLDVPIEVFLADVSTRAANVIRAELASFDRYKGTGTFDIEPPYTVRHLCMFSKKEMSRWPQFGKKCLNEVCEMLRARGLQLWESHDERSLKLLREHRLYFKQYEDQITRLQDELSPPFDDKSDAHGPDWTDRDGEYLK